MHAGAAFAAAPAYRGLLCDLSVEAARSGWEAQTPPADGGTPVTLPDAWTTRWPGFDGVVWYRLTFDGACAQGGPLAIWIDYLNMAGAIFLNGALIDRDKSLGEPLTRAWNTPRCALLPGPDLRPGVNTLLVRVSGLAAYQPGLGPVAVGALSAVRPFYDHAWGSRRDWDIAQGAQETDATGDAMPRFRSDNCGGRGDPERGGLPAGGRFLCRRDR